MKPIETLHEIARERYYRHLKECYPAHLEPEEFVQSLDYVDFMDDQRVHKMIQDRGIDLTLADRIEDALKTWETTADDPNGI